MAITVIEPPKISFSNNPIILKFQADGEGVVNGVHAVNAIVLTGPVTDGTRLTVRWNGKEQILRAADNPNTLGSEFPTGNGNAAYASALASWFGSNYFFNEDFAVTSGTNAGNPAVIFTAKKAGKVYNFSAGTFAVGTVTNTAAGKDKESPINESVYIELYVKKRNDADFVRIYDAPLPLEKDRSAIIDLSQEIHAQLEAELPNFSSNAHFYPEKSWLTYMVKFGHAGGENFTIGQMGNTGFLYAALGGTSYESGSGQTPELLLKGATAATDKLLTLHGFHRVIRRDQPVFAGFLNVRVARATSTLRIVVKYSDNTTQTVNRPDAGAIGLYEKVMWPVGFNQLSLGTLQPSKIVVSYTVQLFTGATAISDVYTYLIDYSTRKQVRYFSYTNSFGVPDTLYCYGEGSSELKVFRDQAEHVLRYDYEIPDGSMGDWDLQTQETASCSSGFIPFRYVTYFHDFFLSQKKHRVISGVAYPISVNTESLKKWADNDNQFAIAFDYQYNYRNRQVSFTDLEKELVNSYEQMPAGLVPGGSVNYTPPPQEGMDTSPTEGSQKPITSHAVWTAIQNLQPRVTTGDGSMIILGNGMLIDAESLINSLEKDATVPAFLKSITSSLGLLNKIKEVDGAGSGLDADRVNGRTLTELQDSENHTLEKLDDYINESGLPTNSDNITQAIAKLAKKVTTQSDDQHPLFQDVPVQYIIKGYSLDYDTDLRHFLHESEDSNELEIVSVNFFQKVEGLSVTKKQGLVIHFSGLVNADIFETQNPLLVVVRRKAKPNSQIIVPVPVGTVQFVEAVPEWLTKLDITYVVSSHDSTIWAETTRNIEMRIEAEIGSHPSGLNHNLETWDINNWNQGTTQHISAPYTELFRFNPWGYAQGGLLPDTNYIATFRREDEQSVFYQVPFRTPSANVTTPESILPEVAPELPACPAGPTLLGITAVTNTGLNFNFHGNGVDEADFEILSGITLKRSGFVEPETSVVPLTFAHLDPGEYTLRIRGRSCSSPWSSMTFTVAGAQTSSYLLNAYKNDALFAINYNGGTIQTPVTSWDIKAVKPANPNYGYFEADWYVKKPDGSWVRMWFWLRNDGSQVMYNYSKPVGDMSAEQSIIPENWDTGLPDVRYNYDGDPVPNTAKYITDPGEYRLDIRVRSGDYQSPVIAERSVYIVTSAAPAPSAAKHSVLQIQSPNGVHKAKVITGGMIDLQLSNDGALSDVYPDVYNGAQRRLEILGQWYNVYYTINGLLMGNLNGLILPEGDYFLEKYYALASFFPTAQSMANMTWELKNDRVAQRPTVQITIGEGIFPPTFYPYFLTEGVPVSGGRISAYKMQFANYTHAQLFAHGSTHDLDTGGGDPDIPAAKKMALIKLATTGLGPNSSESEYYQAGRNYCAARGNSPELIAFEEFGEELDNLGAYERRGGMTRAWFEGYRDEMQDAHPGMQVHEFNSFGGYGGLENLGEPNRIRESPSQLEMYRTHLSSTSQARKYYNPGTTGFESNEHSYFSTGKYNSQNVCIRMYYFNASNIKGDLLPLLLYKIEKMYIAAPDRSQIIFGWELVQDMINHLAEKNGFWYYSTSPAGRLYVGGNGLDVMPPYVGYWVGYLSSKLMKGYAVWSDRSGIDDVPVSGNQTTIFGRREGGNWYDTGWDKKWKPEGGPEVSWENGNPAHLPREGATGAFSKYPLTGLDAYYQGGLECDNKQLPGAEIHWAKFSANGGGSWYTPNPGSLGTKLSALLAPNFNTKNPVIDILANAMGIAFIEVNTTHVLCTYINTYRTPMQTENVIFQWEGKNYNLGSCRGSTLYVQTFTK